MNVIKYCKRPFELNLEGLSSMNREIIARWNATVTTLDEVYMLGDWSMHNPKWYLLLKRLNFAKLYWVVGNHDKRTALENMLAPGGSLEHLHSKVQVFSSCYVTLAGKEYFCVHRPMHSRDDIPTICGHVHERWRFRKAGDTIGEHSRKLPPTKKVLKQPILNVGVDVHNFFPISESDVVEYFESNGDRPSRYIEPTMEERSADGAGEQDP